MNIEFREETPTDIESIYELNHEVFETDAEARLVNALRQANKLVLSMVAVAKEKVIGHIAFSRIKIESQGKRMLVGLGPMAVSEEWQKQGIGSTLIHKAEERLRNMGCDAISVLGHKEYYPKFGYRPSFSNFGIKSKYEVADEYFMVKSLSPSGVSGLSGIVSYESEFDTV